MSEPSSCLLDTARPALSPPVGLFAWSACIASDSPDRSERRSSRRARSTTVLGEIALTAASLVGLAVMILTVTAARTGIQPLVVRSGSMEPTIATGSMVLVERVSAAEIEVGDVVAVERPDHTRVTHRVVALERKGPAVELTLKGDANEDPDPVPVTVREAQRLVWHTPVIGRTVAWLATAQGGFVLGCIATAVALRVLGRRSSSPWRRFRGPVPAGAG